MAESISFLKMQGVGNDFVLVDARGQTDRDWQALAPALCDRRFGIGADGLLIVSEVDDPAADVRMRMFNPDGSEDFCGNGMRCVARYVTEQTASALPHTLHMRTRHGRRTAEVFCDPANAAVRVTVEMGEPGFAPADIPMRVEGAEVRDYPLPVGDETVRVTALSTGSTHTVLFVDALPDEETFQRLSPLIENHPLFPERTSLMWTQVESRARLRIRIWERGAGETLGCGSGACAAAVAAQRHGYTDEGVTVISRGGELHIVWRPGETIRMTGPAEYVFAGTIAPEIHLL